MKLLLKTSFIFFLLSSFNQAFSDVPYYLDFKYILNSSVAGKKAQDELKKRLISENYSVGVMDGRSKKKERLEVCDEQKAPDILLAQIQSTSEGLNLQHYCQVYFTSPHWNPAVEEQAMARAHRIGQTRPVRTFHFQMEGFGDGQLTLENYCLQVQSKKRELMALID